MSIKFDMPMRMEASKEEGVPVFALRVKSPSMHLGVTTMTRWPRRESATGRLPTTSPSPPVLLQGPVERQGAE